MNPRLKFSLVEARVPATGLVRPPRGVTFAGLVAGGSPTIYLPAGVRERPAISVAMHALATRHPLEGLASPNAWEDLLSAAGLSANVFVVDSYGERWRVLDVLMDPGQETGELKLLHIGRRARRGPIFVDLQAAFGRMIPVVVYKPYRSAQRNPHPCACRRLP